MDTNFDVIVVGAGIFGTCTAYHCQKIGLKTLLLEQFGIGHTAGSSHGKSRITRFAHTEKTYIPLVNISYKQIAELETERNEILWKKTSLLWISNETKIQNISDNLKQYNIDHQILTGKEASLKWNQFDFDDNWKVLVDPMGGVIYADKWMNTFRDEFIKRGGVIHDNEAVTNFKENDREVNIQTENRSYTSGKIIFTVGSWIKKMLPELRCEISPLSILVCYWKAKNQNDNDLLNENNYPVVIAEDNSLDQLFFSLPDTDHRGMIKFCYHTGDLMNDNKNPEQHSEKLVKYPSRFLKKHVPIIDADKPAKIDVCKYTVSPDHHYILGPVSPDSSKVLVGGCGSGSGFKVAPAIGQALAQLASDQSTDIDISFFSASRFLK